MNRTVCFLLFACCLLPISEAVCARAPVSEATEECLGCHSTLHPGIVEFVIDHVGPGRVAAVTDAMAAAGAGDGRYVIGHLEVDVAGGVARLAVDGAHGSPPSSARAAQRAALASTRRISGLK